MKRNRIILALFILLLQAIPYFLAALHRQPGWVFGGFLLNPIDGNSYLAKMQEGWAGGWRFTDLYTAHSSQGAYLFLFYITLGHLARTLNLSLLVVFHAARILAGLGLLGALSVFCDQVFGKDTHAANLAFTLAGLGSGLGWLAALGWGSLSGDFWIAETFPFLSMYANPHFPLGLALVLGLVCLDLGPEVAWKGPLMAFLGLLLSSIQPFGFILVGFLLAAALAGRFWLTRRINPWNLLWTIVPGGGFLLYQLWAIQSDLVLRAWNQQNITPAPALGDFLVSFSPALPFAILGIYTAWKRRELPWVILSAWLVGCGVFVYIPFDLQRRFMTGLYVPVALLGITGVVWLRGYLGRFGKWLVPALFVCASLTNVLVLASGIAGGRAPDSSRPNPAIYLSQSEIHAMSWLKVNTPPESVILAPVQSGLFIPAWAGRRVVYGHPFETVNAPQARRNVEAFYSGSLTGPDAGEFLKSQEVGYIYFLAPPPGENHLAALDYGKIVYEQEDVTIVEVRK